MRWERVEILGVVELETKLSNPFAVLFDPSVSLHLRVDDEIHHKLTHTPQLDIGRICTRNYIGDKVKSVHNVIECVEVPQKTIEKKQKLMCDLLIVRFAVEESLKHTKEFRRHHQWDRLWFQTERGNPLHDL